MESKLVLSIQVSRPKFSTHFTSLPRLADVRAGHLILLRRSVFLNAVDTKMTILWNVMSGKQWSTRSRSLINNHKSRKRNLASIYSFVNMETSKLQNMDVISAHLKTGEDKTLHIRSPEEAWRQDASYPLTWRCVQTTRFISAHLKKRADKTLHIRSPEEACRQHASYPLTWRSVQTTRFILANAAASNSEKIQKNCSIFSWSFHIVHSATFPYKHPTN